MHIKAPKLRQPGEADRHATWLELFFDLVFVVSISQLSDKLIHNLNWVGLFEFIFLFTPIWWLWVIHTAYSTRFDVDSATHFIGTFLIMFAASFMTVQIPSALDAGANKFAAGFILAGAIIVLFYGRITYFIPHLQRMSLLFIAGFGGGLLLWIFSIFLAPPLKFWLWAVGMLIILLTPWLGKNILYKLPSFDEKHVPERFGLFTIIVLGETIAGVILGLKDASWSLTSILFGCAAFILAIVIWFQYYSYLRRADFHCNLRVQFLYVHFPLALSLVMLGVAIEAEIAAIDDFYPANVHNFLYCGTMIWLAFFYLMQRISRNKKPCLVTLCSSIVMVSILYFFSTSSPLVFLIGLDLIFLILLLDRRNYSAI